MITYILYHNHINGNYELIPKSLWKLKMCKYNNGYKVNDDSMCFSENDIDYYTNTKNPFDLITILENNEDDYIKLIVNLKNLENSILPESLFSNIISLNIKNTPNYIKWLDLCPNLISVKVSKISDLSNSHKNLKKIKITNNDNGIENITQSNFPKLQKIMNN